MLKITELCHSFGNKSVIERLSLEFPRVGCYIIMGSSGCGKTTLLNIIAGTVKPTSGRLEFGDRNAKISYMFQEPRLLPWMNAVENVNLALDGKKSTLDEALRFISLVGLKGDASKYPSELSGGMNQRIAFARALAYQGDILLLDEPFNGLDADNALIMIDLIKKYAEKHLVIAVTHTREYADKLSEDIISL